MLLVIVHQNLLAWMAQKLLLVFFWCVILGVSEWELNFWILLKNSFLTKRQLGESELYYKMFPHLHLAKSNIVVEFVFTGFKQNRSRFLKQITKEETAWHDDWIQMDGKDDRYYVEKTGMLEKYLRRPKQLHNNLSFSQFIQRYAVGKPGDKYDFEEDLRTEDTPKMLEDKDKLFPYQLINHFSDNAAQVSFFAIKICTIFILIFR